MLHRLQTHPFSVFVGCLGVYYVLRFMKSTLRKWRKVMAIGAEVSETLAVADEIKATVDEVKASVDAMKAQPAGSTDLTPVLTAIAAQGEAITTIAAGVQKLLADTASTTPGA